MNRRTVESQDYINENLRSIVDHTPKHEAAPKENVERNPVEVVLQREIKAYNERVAGADEAIKEQAQKFNAWIVTLQEVKPPETTNRQERIHTIAGNTPVTHKKEFDSNTHAMKVTQKAYETAQWEQRHARYGTQYLKKSLAEKARGIATIAGAGEYKGDLKDLNILQMDEIFVTLQVQAGGADKLYEEVKRNGFPGEVVVNGVTVDLDNKPKLKSLFENKLAIVNRQLGNLESRSTTTRIDKDGNKVTNPSTYRELPPNERPSNQRLNKERFEREEQEQDEIIARMQQEVQERNQKRKNLKILELQNREQLTLNDIVAEKQTILNILNTETYKQTLGSKGISTFSVRAAVATIERTQRDIKDKDGNMLQRLDINDPAVKIAHAHIKRAIEISKTPLSESELAKAEFKNLKLSASFVTKNQAYLTEILGDENIKQLLVQQGFDVELVLKQAIPTTNRYKGAQQNGTTIYPKLATEGEAMTATLGFINAALVESGFATKDMLNKEIEVLKTAEQERTRLEQETKQAQEKAKKQAEQISALTAALEKATEKIGHLMERIETILDLRDQQVRNKQSGEKQPSTPKTQSRRKRKTPKAQRQEKRKPTNNTEPSESYVERVKSYDGIDYLLKTIILKKYTNAERDQALQMLGFKPGSEPTIDDVLSAYRVFKTKNEKRKNSTQTTTPDTEPSDATTNVKNGTPEPKPKAKSTTRKSNTRQKPQERTTQNSGKKKRPTHQGTNSTNSNDWANIGSKPWDSFANQPFAEKLNNDFWGETTFEDFVTNLFGQDQQETNGINTDWAQVGREFMRNFANQPFADEVFERLWKEYGMDDIVDKIRAQKRTKNTATGQKTQESVKGTSERDKALVALGFEPGSNPTKQEIKTAYRDLMRQHHPDKGGDTEKTKEINVARDTLNS